MSIDGWMRDFAEFVQANAAWAPLIVFLIAFGECVAFLSFLVPATALFTVLATAAGASGLQPLPLALAATAGAGMGFWVSYWFGLVVGPRASQYWPLNKNPDLLKTGHDFFERWGAPGVFFGHFIGPVRAVIAITAGIVRMPPLQFHIANWSASFVWGFAFFYGLGLFGQQLAR
ncbi:MAG: DedA family protein [Hyphomicrobiales bacterium]|nr:DedA family protein [Hyphomicrobiales bacterium]